MKARTEPVAGTDCAICCHLNFGGLSCFGRLFPGSVGSLEQVQPSYSCSLAPLGPGAGFGPHMGMSGQLLPSSGNAGLSPCQEAGKHRRHEWIWLRDTLNPTKSIYF